MQAFFTGQGSTVHPGGGSVGVMIFKFSIFLLCQCMTYSSECFPRPSNFQCSSQVHLKPGDPGYGKPQEGTKTAARGRNAHQVSRQPKLIGNEMIMTSVRTNVMISVTTTQHISGEIVELCEVISLHGRMTGRDHLFMFWTFSLLTLSLS